jgi:hypothetical protein
MQKKLLLRNINKRQITMKKRIPLVITFVFSTLLLLTGCASIMGGRQQTVMIETTPVQGAQCYLSNDKGQWYLCSTPGAVIVHRSYSDLIITAQKPGYQEACVRLSSRTRGMVFGNVLFGGCIGAGVDCADGAAYHYPEHVVIPMVPMRGYSQ